MSFASPNATEWAREHSLGADVRFGRLEVMAFQRHPEIYALFGSDGALAADHQKRHPPGKRRSGYGGVVLGVLLFLISLLGAVAGMLTVGPMLTSFRPDGIRIWEVSELDPVEGAAIAGIAFGIVLVAQAVVTIDWLRRRRWWDPALFWMSVVNTVTGICAVATLAVSGGILASPMWSALIIASIPLSAGSAIAVVSRRGHIAPEVDAAQALAASGAAPGDANAAVAGLPEDERLRIRADCDQALGVLRERGLITTDQEQRGRETPLGRLHTLDARG